MSAAAQPVLVPDVSRATPARRKPRRKWGRWLAGSLVLIALGGAAFWYGRRAWRDITGAKKEVIPTARVLRGDVTLDVTARGELRGGNPEMLIAPMTGGLDMHLTSMLDSGAEVKAGQVIAEFDTTEQEYKLREAEADLAETEQKLMQARAMRDAQEDEDRYALLKASSDVKLAELEVRKNPLLPSLTARQNTLALEAARDHSTQLQHNLANRKATNDAAIAIQEAARGKAESQAKTARQNIEAMTLKAHRDGYVSIQQNSNQNMMYFGMTLPAFQVGDTVRPGMAVAQIPDLKNWEVG
ncbi:MAG: biotin/lipoyl-binding protein, partial [Acidobacteriota bacterium]